jgi:hypothetical protein
MEKKIIMKYNYEVGGKVKIRGKWYEILGVDPDNRGQPVRISADARWVWEEFIQGYEAPTPEPKPPVLRSSVKRGSEDK